MVVLASDLFGESDANQTRIGRLQCANLCAILPYMKSNVRSLKPKVNADWHPADVVAALRKAGWSLRRLSQQHGYQATVLSSALRRPWPKAERLIASAIGVSPDQIWPSRYQGKTS